MERMQMGYTSKNEFCERYKKFLDKGVTERKCIGEAGIIAFENGFNTLKERPETFLKAGDKVIVSHMKKAMALFVIGSEPLENGLNIITSHVDSPRIDVKQATIQENKGIAYFDTHYYGGIKKYQWVNTPLAIHGVVYNEELEKIEIDIGSDSDDPVFVISDLLIHLSSKQMEEKGSHLIDGEKMDVIIGNDYDVSGESGNLKGKILSLFKEKYSIKEEDFYSAELELVPAGKARDCGMDRNMILAYGQDDRSCVFSSLKSITELDKPKRTACCILIDKEEIGSAGATGMQSRFMENSIAKVMQSCGAYSEINLRKTLENSCMISADVTAAYDPMFAEAYAENSSAFLSKGIAISKYTGARGKNGANDANAEYVAQIRKILLDNDIKHQFCEMGKVDQGGGGTVSYLAAAYGMNVIDAGVPLLGMHAPYETSNKDDLYQAYKAYKAFFEKMTQVKY